MSTNGINVCEEAEMADCDDEKVVTMMDVLKEQEDFEEDANAVLGASDDKNCTYSKGYVKRQAIYACMTCTDSKNDATKWAGVCLACSLNCHENHDLIELYTKRNFRCDCGNPKFKENPCQFTPNKNDCNVENIYNQNFSGVYCICQRPYPDPESSTQEEMIQCIICEDWLHSNHLDSPVPNNDLYSEMICKACMDKNEFLHDYSDLTVNKEDMEVDILNTSSEANLPNCNEITQNDSNLNVNSDNMVEEQEYDANVENANDKDEPRKEEQIGKESSENTVTPNESAQISPTLNKDNVSETNESKTETEGKVDTESEETKTPADITEEVSDKTIELSSAIEETATPIDESVTASKENQDKVEEDLLLAEPMETDLDQKDEITTANPNEPNTDGFINDIKSDIKTVEIALNKAQVPETADIRSLENKSQYDNVPVIEKSENVSTAEDADTAEKLNINSDKLDIVTPVEQKEALNTEHLEDTSESGKTESATNTEQPNNISSITESENVESKSLDAVSTSEQSDNIEAAGKLDQNEKTNNKKDASSNDNNTEANNLEIAEAEVNTSSDKLTDKTIETDVLKRKLSSDGDPENVEVKKSKLGESKCIRQRGVSKVHHGATFWPSNFRQKLCTCNECISMYKDLSVLFLIDPEDTVTAYETLGKEKTDGKPASQYEKGMAALSSLGRVQQINALTEYGKLRDKLLDFLKTFKDKKVIVKEEDIKAFFAGMKPVREPDGVYFCR